VGLDAQRVPIRRWKLAGAWPARLSGPELSSTANAVAYESLEIAFDSMSVEAS
jgi:phage tail-like protein